MYFTARYNPEKDIQAVDQTGFVDLAMINAESSIPSIVPLSEEHFNGIEDPRSIAGRPSDSFEAAQAAKVITDYKPSTDDSSKE